MGWFLFVIMAFHGGHWWSFGAILLEEYPGSIVSFYSCSRPPISRRHVTTHVRGMALAQKPQMHCSTATHQHV
ncbi:hypothetical protein BKA58DRAFT_204414 [Alternaria rosae]|uniref:uncharacterized protein n=1 Tax=Alternaria rosae TaxID=1187941 RepID=UPI001E8D0BAF|nr:uncharacterized protein BKA58DRAFT_204414 [Alternaria rosae]KAH6866420.1 hypothetical protein BKA58DRAFT_204414 [Alternaria rosae]